MSIATICTCGHGPTYCTDSVEQCKHRVGCDRFSRESVLEWQKGENEESDVPDLHVGDMPQKGLRFVRAIDRLPQLPEILPKDTPDERGILFVCRRHSAARFWYPSYGQSAEDNYPLEKDMDRIIYDAGWGREEWEWLEELPAVEDKMSKEGSITSDQNLPKDVIQWIRSAEHDYSHVAGEQDDFRAGAISIYRHLQQFTETPETPAPGDDHIHVQLPSGGIAAVSPDASPELLGALDKMVELAKKTVPVQQGEVPKEIMHWVDTVSDAYGRTNIYSFPWPASEDFDPVTNQSVPYKDGAIAMYHRDQEERDCLKSEIMGHKKAYAIAIQEKNAAEEQIKAPQSQIAEYRKVLGKIANGASGQREGKAAQEVLEKYKH